VSSRRMLLGDPAMFMSGGRMLLGFLVLASLVMMSRLMVMMRGGVVMSRCLVMMLTRRMLH
jgi:hypothetical protein